MTNIALLIKRHLQTRCVQFHSIEEAYSWYLDRLTLGDRFRYWRMTHRRLKDVTDPETQRALLRHVLDVTDYEEWEVAQD